MSLEKKVLYGICRYPDLNDVELAQRLEVKRSSLTAVRNRLTRKGVVKNFYLPNLERLNVTVMGACFGSFKPGIQFTKRRQTAAFAKISRVPYLVFAKTTDTDYLGFFLGRDYAEVKWLLHELWVDRYTALGFLAETTLVMSPVKLAHTERFFDFTDKLRELFAYKLEALP